MQGFGLGRMPGLAGQVNSIYPGGHVAITKRHDSPVPCLEVWNSLGQCTKPMFRPSPFRPILPQGLPKHWPAMLSTLCSSQGFCCCDETTQPKSKLEEKGLFGLHFLIVVFF